MFVQPGLCSSNDLRVGRKMATFQLFFQSGRAKDLSAPLYIRVLEWQLFLRDGKYMSFWPHSNPTVKPLEESIRNIFSCDKEHISRER